MGFESSFETICRRIAELSPEEIKRQILDFRGRVKLDFTESYLNTLSTDKLRHILAAVLITDCQKQAG